MELDNTEPRYVISVAARRLGVQAHTLRYGERIGIIKLCGRAGIGAEEIKGGE